MLTREDQVLVVAGGRPTSPDFDAANQEMIAICEDIQQVYKFKPGASTNRRGDYNSVSIGVSYGGGQQVRRHGTMLALKAHMF